jgi:hypothetical protein
MMSPAVKPESSTVSVNPLYVFLEFIVAPESGIKLSRRAQIDALETLPIKKRDLAVDFMD